MNDTTKGVLATVAILVVIFSIVAAAAYTIWSGTITGRPRTTAFTIWDSPLGGTQLGQPYTIDVGAVDSPHSVTFYIENDGTIDITVLATGLGTGCSGTWTNSGSYSIPVGTTRTEATLTLTFVGEFSYTFDFTVA